MSLCVPPRTRQLSLLLPSAAVSQRDGGAEVPADPITRPTNQACESTNAHRHWCRVCGGGRAEGEGKIRPMLVFSENEAEMSRFEHVKPALCDGVAGPRRHEGASRNRYASMNE